MLSPLGLKFDLASRVFSPGRIVQEVSGEVGSEVGLQGGGWGFMGGKYGEMGADGDGEALMKGFYDPSEFYDPKDYFNPQRVLDDILENL